MHFSAAVKTSFGEIERNTGEDDSFVLAQSPTSEHPNLVPTCATCPADD